MTEERDLLDFECPKWLKHIKDKNDEVGKNAVCVCDFRKLKNHLEEDKAYLKEQFGIKIGVTEKIMFTGVEEKDVEYWTARVKWAEQLQCISNIVDCELVPELVTHIAVINRPGGEDCDKEIVPCIFEETKERYDAKMEILNKKIEEIKQKNKVKREKKKC